MNSQTLLEVAEYLKTQAEKMRVAERLWPRAAEVPESPAPFGTYPDGKPKPAPAYDACKPLWEAAQRAGAFDIFQYIGKGIQEGAAQMYDGHVTDWRAVEDAIVALGLGEWGQAWLAHDLNAEMISFNYLKRFVGYTVKRIYDSRGDLIAFDHVK